MNKLIDNGLDVNHVNLVVFGDGFKEGEEEKFNTAVEEKIGYFFSIEPVKTNKYKFNVYSSFNASADSGINHPNLLGGGCYGQPELVANTYFGCSFDSFVGSSRIHRAIAPKSEKFVKDAMVKILPASLNKNNYIPIIICNSEYEGGLDDGIIVVCTLSPYSNDTLCHEFQHVLGSGDEYGNSVARNVDAPNTTPETCRWKASFPNGVPATDGYGIGMYKNRFNYIIPTLHCKMNTITENFCKVCQDIANWGMDFLITTSGGVVPSPPNPNPPPPPITCTFPVLQTVKKNRTSITIQWQKQDNIDHYVFEKRITGSVVWMKPSVVLSAISTQNRAASLKPNTTYDFQLTAYCKDGKKYPTILTDHTSH